MNETKLKRLDKYYQFNQLGRKVTGEVGSDTDVWVDENKMIHREGGPAKISRDKTTGQVTAEAYFKHGKRHREDGTNYTQDGYKKLFESKQTFKQFFCEADDIIRTVNKQAKTIFYGSGKIRQLEYWKDGKQHRLDGPAIITHRWDTGKANDVYYVDGVKFTREEFNKRFGDVDPDLRQDMIDMSSTLTKYYDDL